MLQKYKIFSIFLILILLVVTLVFTGSISIRPVYDSINKILYNISGRSQLASLSGEGSGLIGWWKFDEGSGTNAGDSAGGNNGTLINGTTWVAGKTSNTGDTAVAFDGSDDYVDLGVSSSYSGLSSFTVGGWIKSNNPSQSLIQKFAGCYIQPEFLIARSNSDSVYFWVYTTNGNAIAQVSFPMSYQGEWHHVVGVYDGNNVTIYLDGVKGNQTQLTGVTIPGSNHLEIGRDASCGQYSSMSADDVRFYNRALTPEEIQSLHTSHNLGSVINNTLENPPVPIPDDTNDLPIPSISPSENNVTDTGSNLIGWWKFDESSGTIATDSTGNSNGTLIGNPSRVGGKVGSGALSFNGTNNYIDAGDIDAIDGAKALTVSAWFKFNSTPTGAYVLVSKWDQGSGGPFMLWTSAISESVLFSTMTTNGLLQASFSMGAGDTNWHHIVGVYNGRDVKVYLDGVAGTTVAQTQPQPGTLKSPDIHKVRIAASESGDYFPGSVDDVRIYTKDLSESEIVQLYSDQGGVLYVPTANGSVSPVSGVAPLEVSFSSVGSVATRPGGSLDSYDWDFGDGKSGTGATVTHTYTTVGKYIAKLTVTDDHGAKASKTLPEVSADPDVISPDVFNASPSGKLNAGTIKTPLSVNTSEIALCKYSTIANTNFDTMTTFSITNDTNHSTTIPDATSAEFKNGQPYIYYIKCKDPSGNFSGEISTSFSIRDVLVLPDSVTVITGSNSLVDTEPRAIKDSRWNFLPNDGETVDLNPPRFTWPYNAGNNYSDWTCYAALATCAAYEPHLFIFQITDKVSAGQPDFTNPVVNVTTNLNFYNTIGPLTSSPSRTYYWRVGYIDPKSRDVKDWTLESDMWPDPLTPSVCSATRTFRIASNAPVWDRSMLTDDPKININHTGYLATHAAHPHLLFNDLPNGTSKTNREQMAEWLEGGGGGQMWQTMKTDAYNYAASSKMSQVIFADDLWGWDAKLEQLARVAFVWQMTRDPKLLAGDGKTTLTKAFADAAQWLDDHGAIDQDYGGGRPTYFVRNLAYGYDWLYNGAEMSASEKIKIFNVIEKISKVNLPRISIRPYNIVGTGSLFKQPESHSRSNFASAIVAALAAYGDPEATYSRKFLDFGVNFMIGQLFFYGNEEGVGEGRGYGVLPFVDDMGGADDYFDDSVLLHTVFPDLKFNLNSGWNKISDWIGWMIPVGFISPNDPFGENNNYAWSFEYLWGHLGKRLAQFTGSGVVAQHAEESLNLLGWNNSSIIINPPHKYINNMI